MIKPSSHKLFTNIPVLNWSSLTSFLHSPGRCGMRMAVDGEEAVKKGMFAGMKSDLEARLTEGSEETEKRGRCLFTFHILCTIERKGS